MTKEIMVQDKVLMVHPKAQATKTSLTLAEDITQDEWEDVVGNLNKVEGAVHWWIGDAFAFAEQKWGMYDRMDLPFEKETIRKDKELCERIESGRRRPNLSHSHHKEVAWLEPEQQDYFLDLAEEQGLNRNELRQAIKEHQVPKDGKVFLMMEDLDLSDTEKQKIVSKVRGELLTFEEAELVAQSVASALSARTKDRLIVMPFDRYEHNPEYAAQTSTDETTTVPAVVWADSPAVAWITTGINRSMESVKQGRFPQEGIPFAIEKAKELIDAYRGVKDE